MQHHDECRYFGELLAKPATVIAVKEEVLHIYIDVILYGVLGKGGR